MYVVIMSILELRTAPSPASRGVLLPLHAWHAFRPWHRETNTFHKIPPQAFAALDFPLPSPNHSHNNPPEARAILDFPPQACATSDLSLTLELVEVG